MSLERVVSAADSGIALVVPQEILIVENQFLFVTCQVGSEPTIKKHLAEDGLRFSFSRPGFLTFKLPKPHTLSDPLSLDNPFVRSFGLCLGKVVAETVEAGADRVWNEFSNIQFDRLHVWPRDRAAAGHRNFHPGMNDDASAAEATLLKNAPAEQLNQSENVPAGNIARRNDRVLDCILVDPQEWWIGTHRVDRWVQRWPGGFWTADESVEMVSRAYLKMSEALAWVSWPIKSGQRCVELGCAPGGASQALLSHGLRVIGIDPAMVDAKVLTHPNFQHIRKRSSNVRVRDFQEVQWLTADMNIAPSDTLDEVERIVCHRANRIRGLILTLKLNDWNLAEQIPSYLERVRGWGYSRVRVRQLSHNRQEVCLAALRPTQKTRRRTRLHRPPTDRKSTD